MRAFLPTPTRDGSGFQVTSTGGRARYQMLIGGRWRDGEGGRALASINPATEEIWAEIADASAADVDAAVTAAHEAFESGPWPRMSPTERGRMLRRFAERVPAAAEHLGRVETTDTGKLFRETRWQAANVAQVYDFYGGLADKLMGEIPPTGAGQPLQLVVREPIGVVAAIVPWNSQLHLAAFKLAPALAAGNTVVLKPSEQASAAVLEFAKLVADSDLPPGVVNVVTGGGVPCGEALTSHPLVRRISFTGGVDTARRIIPNTAKNIARLSLELGGKSPIIVWEDADPDGAASGILAAIFGAGGQSCAAGSRLLVHERAYDDVVGRVIERAKRIAIGDPMRPETQMGPLATRAQVERIGAHLERSVAQGARVLTGGGKPAGCNRGFYFAPTVVACDHQDYPIVQNELFGPVLSVLRFRTEEEAVALANASRYAFAGGIFTRDVARAIRLARAVRAGRIWVNTYRVTSMHVPFGGFKESGYGREAGIDAIRDFTETKGIFIETSGEPVSDPFVMR
jgi:aldehyde dehydrogenase (NAD+)